MRLENESVLNGSNLALALAIAETQWLRCLAARLQSELTRIETDRGRRILVIPLPPAVTEAAHRGSAIRLGRRYGLPRRQCSHRRLHSCAGYARD